MLYLQTIGPCDNIFKKNKNFRFQNITIKMVIDSDKLLPKTDKTGTLTYVIP